MLTCILQLPSESQGSMGQSLGPFQDMSFPTGQHDDLLQTHCRLPAKAASRAAGCYRAAVPSKALVQWYMQVMHALMRDEHAHWRFTTGLRDLCCCRQNLNVNFDASCISIPAYQPQPATLAFKSVYET